ncbi:MAG: SAM-dependent methyltransferase [Chloroflexi bacterium]|nr:SAM-dependent methyltransferase [Chloroflexota bacterium]
MSDEPRIPSLDVGLRRVRELDRGAPLPPSDPELVAKIIDEIRAEGPMTFARFMELALYDPEHGYYVAGTAGPGREGDFLTAPEGHPIFGWTIARRLEQTWTGLDRPSRFVVREHGAGTGARAHGILDGLRRSGSDLLGAIRYQAVEASPARLAALRERLVGDGLDAWLEPADDSPAPGAVIANELLDALPVHRVEGASDGSLLELFVTLGEDGAFEWVRGEPSTDDLAARLDAEGVQLQPGQVAEIGLAIDDWVRAAVAGLEAGLLLVIDYGHPAKELYSPQRGSLLRTYHRHRVHDDPFVAVGRQDLTAHVDLTAVERAAAAAGLTALPPTTQGRFLAELGLGELLVALQTDGRTDLAGYLEARAAVARMLDPRATGGFAVLQLERGR